MSNNTPNLFSILTFASYVQGNSCNTYVYKSYKNTVIPVVISSRLNKIISLLPIACCLLPIAHWLLPTPDSLLPIP
ncbi:hypothetical protein [Moorena sp. SIO3H5]|uniref:hypothetical protein n=1 Tax=Moorena sp. SIO3H5 TaxID=2607834 RepID=UPI0013B7A924|nr:hypothetical protein [Moorena sp. SIO3H5]NEO72845.1 hypothetical protein [Moorena sp. SIO3H5]